MLKLFQDATGVYNLLHVASITPGVTRDPRNAQQVTGRPGILHMISGAWHATVTDFEELVAAWKAVHAQDSAAPAPSPPPASPPAPAATSSTSSNTSSPPSGG